MRQDLSGLFADFNFKLIVIDALLDENPDFAGELDVLKEKFVDNYEWYSGVGPIPELLDFFAELKLSSADLAKVTGLSFDGGNEVYHIIQPDWDGEDEQFDVASVEGYQHLPNLESVFWSSMCEEKVLAPLRARGIEID